MRKSHRAVAGPNNKRPHPLIPGFPRRTTSTLKVGDGDESPSVEAPLQRTSRGINPSLAGRGPYVGNGWKEDIRTLQLPINAYALRWPGNWGIARCIGHPTSAILLVPMECVKHSHLMIRSNRDKQVCAFASHHEPKLPAPRKLDVEAPITEQWREPAPGCRAGPLRSSSATASGEREASNKGSARPVIIPLHSPDC
jgi:hypothetical protein